MTNQKRPALTLVILLTALLCLLLPGHSLKAPNAEGFGF